VVILDIGQETNINEYLINFLLVKSKAKEYCKNVIGIMTYMPYKRQDKEFLKGEAVSSNIIASFIEKDLKYFITCDSHVHRQTLQEIFSVKTFDLSMFMELGQLFLDFKKEDALIVAPDSEAKSFAERFRVHNQFDYIVMKKVRDKKTGKVKIDMKDKKTFENKDIIIVDDVSASGGTILHFLDLIEKCKVKSISIVLSHGLFIGDVEKKFKKRKIRQMVTSNTIFNEFMKVDCTLEIVKKLKELIK
jgi:ribose-phosphate pyrophosphokinase